MKATRGVLIGTSLLVAGSLLQGCALLEIFGRAIADSRPTFPDAGGGGEAFSCRDTLIVTKEDDTDDAACTPGDCSLREAVYGSNLCPGRQTIQLPAGDYTVASLVFSDGAVLLGEAASTTRIRGRISIDAPASVEISGVTSCCGTGITIQRGAELLLHDAIVRDHRNESDRFARSFLGGGGVNNSGRATIRNTLVEANYGFEAGGGVVNLGGEVDISDSTILGNAPMGVASDGGSVRVATSVLERNAYGIYLAGGSLDVVATTIAASSNMGVFARSWADTTATIESSTIHGTTGPAVDGWCLAMANSTVSGNREGVRIRSAGCDRGAAATLRHVTITGNERYGLADASALGPPWNAEVEASVIAGNRYADCVVEGAAPVRSLGRNLDSDGTCGLDGPGDRSGVDASLGPLAHNGGSTQTHALLSGSVAIDAAGPTCVLQDQRGILRPQGPACDVGAFEVEAAGMAVEPLSGRPPSGAPREPSPCRLGPANAYPLVRYVDVDDLLEILARDFGAIWLQVRPGGKALCWTPGDKLNFDPPELDPKSLPLGSWPALPTKTPKAGPSVGCLIQNPNNPNDPKDLICVPRACGPNDYPGGTCTP